MDWLKQNEFHSYALALQASSSLVKMDFLSPMAFWVGSEGEGLPDDLVKACDGTVTIPMTGKVESLNVGVAASLALFWAQFGRPVP